MAKRYYVYNNKNFEAEGMEGDIDPMDTVIDHCKKRAIQYMDSRTYNTPYQYLYICVYRAMITSTSIRWVLTSSLNEMEDCLKNHDTRTPDEIYRFLIFSTNDSYNIMELPEEAEGDIIASEKKCYALYNSDVLEAMKKYGRKKGDSDETV
ncbi:hypothetical protein [uncultured Duncaniella sp.]|uniref:hypothetical protein n=1 Tax=uncultured Duncaniella sp. TaxID=2768039 RepID=UPI002602290C|nr:hypothetical protein [uncultured Duncaniella sp.]